MSSAYRYFSPGATSTVAAGGNALPMAMNIYRRRRAIIGLLGIIMVMIWAF